MSKKIPDKVEDGRIDSKKGSASAVTGGYTAVKSATNGRVRDDEQRAAKRKAMTLEAFASTHKNRNKSPR